MVLTDYQIQILKEFVQSTSDSQVRYDENLVISFFFFLKQ